MKSDYSDTYNQRKEGERFENVLRQYCNILGFDKHEKKADTNAYDMSQRLRLADIVARDGNNVVADLGSQGGGMAYALKDCGVRAVATEFDYNECKDYLKKLGMDVIHCNSFYLPLKADAAVSYMFLGQNLPSQLRKDRKIKDIFDMLSRTTDTIYSVELQAEYSDWFGHKQLESGEIEERLKECLPDFQVEYIGDFGVFSEGAEYDGFIDRIGFKFTRKNRQVI